MDFDSGPIIDAHISPYTVGFVLVDGDNPRPLGSGVLVRCKSIQGILTCGHVLRSLPLHSDFGIVHFGTVKDKLQGTRIPGNSTAKHAVCYYDPPMTMEGPDIAFVPIPTALMATLSSVGSIIDLDFGRQKAASAAPPGAIAFEAVSGVIGQLTQPASIKNSVKILSVKGLVNIGKVVAAPMVGQWDQLHFKPLPEPGFVLPTDYQGTSGGGIWKIYVRKNADDTYNAAETRLTGIAYWQDQVDLSHGIIGHGPQSIYGHLLNEIYHRWPTA